MDKLQSVLSVCSNGFSLRVDGHKLVRMGMGEYLGRFLLALDRTDARPANETLVEIIARDRVVELEARPADFGAGYKILHWDLNEALNELIKVLKEDEYDV